MKAVNVAGPPGPSRRSFALRFREPLAPVGRPAEPTACPLGVPFGKAKCMTGERVHVLVGIETPWTTNRRKETA